MFRVLFVLTFNARHMLTELFMTRATLYMDIMPINVETQLKLDKLKLRDYQIEADLMEFEADVKKSMDRMMQKDPRAHK